MLAAGAALLAGLNAVTQAGPPGPGPGSSAVGVLLRSTGQPFCTASVVSSPGAT